MYSNLQAHHLHEVAPYLTSEAPGPKEKESGVDTSRRSGNTETRKWKKTKKKKKKRATPHTAEALSGG
ncbi:hypothetical protein BDP55DRAFT_670369 [Colletotrichum godetiae]|uniref:Uncharacterized protein n=1 Tax=Colletotrichum godetiae TaxID=1209918 RepID=A0AAJ0ES44_9PEZI|nr:uncharacterized protein BDP55DRAFT_670369 [Colletotrichum godetiae]KAK1673477.1 hypothetical protein BDP55DRAFT_670369 [Colletotrichum godetiae]